MLNSNKEMVSVDSIIEYESNFSFVAFDELNNATEYIADNFDKMVFLSILTYNKFRIFLQRLNWHSIFNRMQTYFHKTEVRRNGLLNDNYYYLIPKRQKGLF